MISTRVHKTLFAISGILAFSSRSLQRVKKRLRCHFLSVRNQPYHSHIRIQILETFRDVMSTMLRRNI